MMNLNSTTSPLRPAAFVLSLVMSALFASITYANPEPEQPADSQAEQKTKPSDGTGVSDELIYSGDNAPPWRMYLGNSNNWMVPIAGPLTNAHKSKVVSVRVIDNVAKDDAYQAEWRGGLGQVYWQADKPRDYRELAAAGGALSMVIRIDKKPKKTVEVKMDCGYPCAGTLNMTNLFKSVPEGQWFRISLKLSCFKDAGANLGNILAPLVVATKGDFIMSFAEVRLLTNPPPESIVACG
jgi:beta-glucosidase